MCRVLIKWPEQSGQAFRVLDHIVMPEVKTSILDPRRSSRSFSPGLHDLMIDFPS